MFNFKYNVDADVFLKDAKELLLINWDELGEHQDKMALIPDLSKYKLLQDLGALYNIVVYNNKNEVVGYSVVIVQQNVHHTQTLFASVDVIYISPEHRSGTLGARMLIETENLARTSGASMLLHYAKPYAPMIIKPLEKLGYKLYEYVYGKYIGE